MTLKEKLGLGFDALKEEDKEIADSLANAVKNDCLPKRNRFHSMMASTVTSIMQDLVAPWINQCFEKYTEEEFHDKMYRDKFDFIADWQQNHPTAYKEFLRASRIANKMHMLNLDHYAIFNVVMEMFNKRGWFVTDYERIKLLETILKIIAEICR